MGNILALAAVPQGLTTTWYSIMMMDKGDVATGFVTFPIGLTGALVTFLLGRFLVTVSELLADSADALLFLGNHAASEPGGPLHDPPQAEKSTPTT